MDHLSVDDAKRKSTHHMHHKGHTRRPTFDSSTEFPNYVDLFDDDTKEILQKDESRNVRSVPTIDDLKQQGIYQPPMVNDGEIRQMMHRAAKLTLPHHSTNGHLQRWHYSRRRTLDELDTRGVLRANLYQFDSLNAPSRPLIGGMPQSTRAHMGSPRHFHRGLNQYDHERDTDPSSAATTAHRHSLHHRHYQTPGAMLDVDELEIEDLELSRHDLYFVHCHQVVPKSQEAVFKQLLKESMAFNVENPIGTRAFAESNKLPRHSPLKMVIYKDTASPQSMDLRGTESGTFSIDPSPAPPPPRAQFDPIHGAVPFHGEKINDHFGAKFTFHPMVIHQKSNKHLIGAIGSDDDEIDLSDSNHNGLSPNHKQNHNQTPNRIISPRPNLMENAAPSSALRTSYDCIPRHIDGGLLSSGIFLPYKQWCESSIIRHTEQAGECLDQMKKESNVLAALHRSTIMSDSLGQGLYEEEESFGQKLESGGGGAYLDRDEETQSDDDENGGISGVHQSGNRRSEREEHLRKLSQIDDNLADVGDKIRKMVRVQQHIAFIQQQYDSHLEPLRKDQLELISFWSELREMLNRNESQLKALRDDEVWTITNIANTIAERSERIDSLNRRIARSTDEVAKRRWTETVSSMKQWIGSLHAVIERLQSISNRKSEEVDRLKSSMASIWNDVRKLMASSHRAHRQVIGRLFELQNHYGLPAVMETVDDVEGQCHAVTSSLKVVLSKTDCADYFERALSLHQSARILSQRGTKSFYHRFVELLHGVVVDSMVIHEYIETNKYREQNDDEIEELNADRVTLDNSQRSSGHAVAASTDQIVSDIFMPIALSPSTHSQSFGIDEVTESEPHKVTEQQLLHHVLHQNEFGLKFKSIDFLQTLSLDQQQEMPLLKRIETVSIFAHLVPYRETVFLSVAQFVCIEHWQHIMSLNGDKMKISQFAESQVVLLLDHILSTRSNANGLIRRIKRIQKHQRRRGRPLHAERGGKVRGVNVHKMAALILHDVYKIDSPFPM